MHTIVEGEPLVIRVSSVIIPSATMDYFVPEKLPQPENYLESLVWNREKDIDTLVEMGRYILRATYGISRPWVGWSQCRPAAVADARCWSVYSLPRP